MIMGLRHGGATRLLGRLAQRRAVSSVKDTCQLHPMAAIHANAKLGSECRVGAFVCINENVEIGNNCIIEPNVTLANCRIGNNVWIHSGVCIGQDGFGFLLDPSGQHTKKPQELLVEVHDDVEIGANCVIARGSWRHTVIGQGCKLDSLIQIGHNVHLGTGCVLAAQTGIAGSTSVGDNVYIGGQVGIAQHLNIGSKVRIAAKSGVMHDLSSNATYGGSPAVPIMEYRRQMVALRHLGKKKVE